MTLVASTTAYTTSTLSGMQIMTGNEPYTLVGAAYTIPGPAFVDASNQRYVLSWFNKRTRNRRRPSRPRWYRVSSVDRDIAKPAE